MEHDYKNYPELTNAQIEEFGFNSPHEQITADFRADVVKVHDGDTITVVCACRDFQFPVRFLDIDAPEMSEGGETARDWLKEQLLGEEVEIKINKYNRVGKYGRLLGKVFHNGLDMSEAMLSMSLVVPFGQKNQASPPDLNKYFRLEQWF